MVKIIRKDDYDKLLAERDHLKEELDFVYDAANKLEKEPHELFYGVDIIITSRSVMSILSETIVADARRVSELEDQVRKAEAERDWYKLKYGELLSQQSESP